MTIELTHEQAFSARMFIQSDATLKAHLRSNAIIVSGKMLGMDKVKEALAAYDAKWVPVERWRLQEVSDYISECDPPIGAPDDEVTAYHVASVNCQIMLTGKDAHDEPTDGSCSPP